jgi:hypothetical protein
LNLFPGWVREGHHEGQEGDVDEAVAQPHGTETGQTGDDQDVAIASFYCQLDAWASDMLCKFYLVKKNKTVINLTMPEVVEN